MAITLTSTTSSKEDMEHAVSENWREAPIPVDPPKVDTEAPEVEETQPEAAAEPEPAEKQESKPKSRAQRAIDKLTARNHKLEAELEEARKRVTPADTKAAPAQIQAPPKLQDFLNAGKTAEDWADARDAWKEASEIAQEQEATQKSIFNTYNKSVSEARGRYEDWDETVESASESVIPQAAGLAVFEMDNGPDVAYYLAKHPEVCDELHDMTPIAAIRAIGKISDSLKPETKSSPEKKQKVTPTAPITPVSASSTRSSTPLDEMSMRDYIRVRNKQERDRRH